jgi:hypothetical protein
MRGGTSSPASGSAGRRRSGFDLSLEYYGATGPLSDPLPSNEQVHQFFPGGDFQVTPNIVFNFGVGFGVTDAGNRLVSKTRLGWMF